MSEDKVIGSGTIGEPEDLGNGFHKVDLDFKRGEWLALMNAAAIMSFPDGTGARSIWDEFHAKAAENPDAFTQEEMIFALGQATMNMMVETALKRGIEIVEENQRQKELELNGSDKASTDLESNG